MADRLLYKIIYTERSLVNIQEIKNYLLYKFTQREVDNLYDRLNAFESIVIVFPDMYSQIAGRKQIRRAVLSKQLSVFYTISKESLIITAILDNRMDNSKWPK